MGRLNLVELSKLPQFSDVLNQVGTVQRSCEIALPIVLERSVMVV